MIIAVLFVALFILTVFKSRKRDEGDFLTDDAAHATAAPSRAETTWRDSVRKRFNALSKEQKTLFIAWPAAYFFVAWWAPEWWWNNLVSVTFIVMAAMWTLFGNMKAPSKVPFSYKLGAVGRGVLAVATVWLLVTSIYGKEIEEWMKGRETKQKLSRNLLIPYSGSIGWASASRIYTGTVNDELVAKLEEGLLAGGLSETEVVTMVEHCKWESGGCNQFKTDGAVMTNPSSSARGMLQILADTHKKDIAEQKVDIDTVDGQIKFTLFLIKRRKEANQPFDQDWYATSPFMETGVIMISVPVGNGDEDWSKIFEWPAGHCEGYPDREMLVQDADNTMAPIIIVSPTIRPATSFKRSHYRVPVGGSPGKVVVRCS